MSLAAVPGVSRCRPLVGLCDDAPQRARFGRPEEGLPGSGLGGVRGSKRSVSVRTQRSCATEIPRHRRAPWHLRVHSSLPGARGEFRHCGWHGCSLAAFAHARGERQRPARSEGRGTTTSLTDNDRQRPVRTRKKEDGGLRLHVLPERSLSRGKHARFRRARVWCTRPLRKEAILHPGGGG